MKLSLTDEKKREIIDQFRLHESDTGSVEVQVALLTARINDLTEHFQTHRSSLQTGLVENGRQTPQIAGISQKNRDRGLPSVDRKSKPKKVGIADREE
jgi:small subunit ribosomal protein S15